MTADLLTGRPLILAVRADLAACESHWDDVARKLDEFHRGADRIRLADAISAWHDIVAGDEELHEFLGLTWEQYGRWVETSDLPDGYLPPAVPQSGPPRPQGATP